MTALIIAYLITGATFSARIILEHVVDDGEPFVRRWGVMPVLVAIIALSAVVVAWPLGLLNIGEKTNAPQ